MLDTIKIILKTCLQFYFLSSNTLSSWIWTLKSVDPLSPNFGRWEIKMSGWFVCVLEPKNHRSNFGVLKNFVKMKFLLPHFSLYSCDCLHLAGTFCRVQTFYFWRVFYDSVMIYLAHKCWQKKVKWVFLGRKWRQKYQH